MTTWIRNKTAKLFAIISYPVNLIPKKGFKKEIIINSINELGPIGIVRRSLKLTKGETFDKFGRVREDALISEPKDIAGLSMNLLGNSFLPRHISYVPIKEAGKDWDGNETQLWRKYIKWVTYKKSSIPIFFLLSDLHNQTFPYYRKKDKEVEKLLKSLNISPAAEEKEVKLNGASIIKHVPAKLNYWHIEFRLLDIEARETGRPSKIERGKFKSAWITQAAIHALNDILLNSAYEFLNIHSYKEITDFYFLN